MPKRSLAYSRITYCSTNRTPIQLRLNTIKEIQSGLKFILQPKSP